MTKSLGHLLQCFWSCIPICNAASDWPRTFFTPRVFLFSITITKFTFSFLLISQLLNRPVLTAFLPVSLINGQLTKTSQQACQQVLGYQLLSILSGNGISKTQPLHMDTTIFCFSGTC